MYYHDDWCFDIIHMTLYSLHPPRHLKHCCISFCTEVSKLGGKTTVVFESMFPFNCHKYMKGLRVLKKYLWFFKSLSVLFYGFVNSANSISRDWLAIIYCSRYLKYIEYFDRCHNLFIFIQPLLLKRVKNRLPWYSWDILICKNGKWSFGQIQKKQWIQNGHAFKKAAVNKLYIYMAQYIIQRVNCVMGQLIFLIIKKIEEF